MSDTTTTPEVADLTDEEIDALAIQKFKEKYPEIPIEYGSAKLNQLKTELPEYQKKHGIGQFAPIENRSSIATSEANTASNVNRIESDYNNAGTPEEQERARAEAEQLRKAAIDAQTSLKPAPAAPLHEFSKPSTTTVDVPDQADSFVDTSDLDTSDVEIEEPKKHDYISTQVRNRTKNTKTRVGTETNQEPEPLPEPAPAPLPEEDLNEAGVTQEDLDDGNVDETNLEAAESGAKENGFDPETADAKAIQEAEQLGTWDKISIGMSVASSILSALTLGIIPPIDFRKFKNTDQKLAQIQQYQKDKRDAAVINNLQKEAESKGITDPQEIRQYVNDRFNSQSRNEQRTQDFNTQNKELDAKLATGMKSLEHKLEMKKLDRQTINKIKEETNAVIGEIKKIKAQGDVNRAQAEVEAMLKDKLAANQSQYDASTAADIFNYWVQALKAAGLPANIENIRQASRATQGATNTTSANLSIMGQGVGGAVSN